MKPRLIILVLVAVGVAVFWAMQKASKVAGGAPGASIPGEAEDGSGAGDLTPGEIERIRITSEPLWKRPLDCERAPEKPTVNVRLEVDTSTGKNRMWLYLTEAHGWYAQYFAIKIWYTGGDDTVTADESKHVFEVRKEEYVRAKDTHKTCIELNPAELAKVGGSIGTSADWKAEVTYTDPRACIADPNPLPLISESTCR